MIHECYRTYTLVNKREHCSYLSVLVERLELVIGLSEQTGLAVLQLVSEAGKMELFI